MNKKKIIFVLFIFVLLVVTGVFASVNLVNENIFTNYSGGEIVKGKVFLSIANEPTSSIVKSNFLGNIGLFNLLKLQSNLTQGVSYTCNTLDCEGTYTSQGVTDGFLVSENSPKFAGFVVSGTGVAITGAKFSVQTNAVASCMPQINVDVLADGYDLLTNSESNGESCGTTYSGCYNQSNTNEATIFSNKEYCERVSLPASSAFIVGGEIRNGTVNANLTMKLYDSTEGLAGSCLLPKHTQNIQELKCRINYTASEPREYYVCITSSGSGGYKIGWETQTPKCGTAEGFGTFNSDFDLFAETTKYSASPNFIVNETTYEAQFNVELDAILDGYISDKYNRQCQPNPCVIPISFYGANQYIQLTNAGLEYETVGVPNSVSGIYDVSYADASLTGTNLSIDIAKANFTIPIDSEENKFKLFIDDSLILERDISIKEGFIFDIGPKFVSFGQNVQFSIIANKTITNSTWNFGDGTAVQQVNGESVSHAFTQKNNSNFLISVTAKDNAGLEASKQFNIFVGDPRIIANQTIIEYKKRIDNLTSQINLQPTWMIQKLQEIINLSELSSKIGTIENSYKTTTNLEGYQNVMLALIALNMPIELKVIESGQNLPLSISYANINSNYIERIDNKDLTDNSELSNRIVAWMNTYFNADISFKKISLVGDYGTQIIATTFKINTNPNQVDEEYVYLIFGQDIENTGLYKENYNVKSINSIGIDYLELKPSSNEVFEFVFIGDISAESLGAYISPQIDALGVENIPDGSCNLDNVCGVEETADSCPEDCSKKWIKFSIISWIILGVVFIVVYIILQEWYKRNYQKQLFPEENDLYNLMNFIYTARRSRLDDEQILVRLRDQWSAERISFAFKRISGKRIGMLEIPLFTHGQHKQTLEKLSVKQGAPIDARFIKRPSFT